MDWPRYPAFGSLGQTSSLAAFSSFSRRVQCLSGLALQTSPLCPTILPEVVYFSYVLHPLIELNQGTLTLLLVQRAQEHSFVALKGILLSYFVGLSYVPCWMVHSPAPAQDSFEENPKEGWSCLPSHPHSNLAVAHL